MKLDSVDRMEIKALAFYKMTGQLAPGKDRPAVSGADVDEDELQQQWRDWIVAYGKVIHAMFAAFEEQTDE